MCFGDKKNRKSGKKNAKWLAEAEKEDILYKKTLRVSAQGGKIVEKKSFLWAFLFDMGLSWCTLVKWFFDITYFNVQKKQSTKEDG